MGLTAKIVALALLFAIVISPQIIHSQNQDCSISAPFAPERIYAQRFAGTAAQTDHFLATANWNKLDSVRVSDNQYMSIDLERYDRSHIIRFSDFGFNVPELATIDGLRIGFEGKVIGEGDIRQMQVQFFSNGPVGNNVAQLPSLLGTEWINDSLTYDRLWKYGHHTDKWGKEWTASEVNSSEFGFVLQIENQTDEFIQAFLDQVSISVYYTPPHNLCAHECVVFSTEPIDGVTNYQWEFPSNFDQIFSPVNQHILNLNVLDNVEGSYQVCVTPEGHSRCCMDFVIMDCSLGSIGSLVWKDSNNNGVQDPGEEGIPNVRVQLFNESGYFLEDLFTDNNGNYLFDELYAGNYKVKTSEPIDDCEVSTTFNADDNTNSDYNPAYGPTCSAYFNLAPGQNRDDIDFGWSFKQGSIAGCIFRDRNGDSSIVDEPGIEGVTVTLLHCDGTVAGSTVTNSEGRYVFEELQIGQYYISTGEMSGFVAATGGDSAFGQGSYSSTCVDVMPNEERELKFGYIPLSSLGDYVFYDENSNGTHEVGDWPITSLQVFLYNSANEQLATTVTNSDGFYLFDNLPAGDYYVIANYPSSAYLPTVTNSDDDPSIDSNGTDIGNMQVSSELINLFDGNSNLTIDFGFVKRTASITGTYFRDGEADGSMAGNSGIPGAMVAFYNCNGALIATRTTDANGQFTFTGFVGQNYHIVFSPVAGMMSSTLGESQIDNVFTEGSTACFTIQDETTVTINGAAIPYSRVGDMVWDDENRNGIYDDGENGMENVEITLFDSNSQLVATTFTNAEGIYIFENLLPDMCYIEIKPVADYEITESNAGSDDSIDSDASMVNGVISSESFNLVDGYENMDMDFGFRRSGGSVSGRLWDDGDGNSIYENEGGIADRMIRLISCDGTEITSTVTNVDGVFNFTQIPAGDYYVVVEDLQGGVFALGGESQITNLIEQGATDCFSVTVAQNLELLMGIIPTSTIGDFIWIDQNQNGTQDATEIGLSNVSINLLDVGGQVINSTQSNADGRYSFTEVPAANYTIRVEILGGYNLTQSNVGDFNTDSEGTIVGGEVESSMLAVRDGIDQNDHDFGFFESTGSLSGTVWRDSNGDELNQGESGIEGITLSLYSCDVVLLNTTQTDANGNYSFDNLNSDQYFVVVNPLPDFDIATSGDSQVNNVIMQGATNCVNVDANANGTLNIGYIPLASIGDFIWFDEDKNGLQDPTESGLHDVAVGLTDSAGGLMEITQSDENGFYEFADLRPGSYTIRVTIPGEEFTNTISLAGDSSLDSEGTLINDNLTSGAIVLFDGIDQYDHDFGFIEKEEEPVIGDINGTYFRDRDGDGILFDEPGIGSATIVLKNCDGTFVANVLTNADGTFSFTGVLAGGYYLVFPTQQGFTNVDFGESQIDNMIEEGATACFTVVPDLGIKIDGGSIPLNEIGDFVWLDENKDGIQDIDEVGIEDIVINLYDDADVFISNTTSDANGFYQFKGLLPGNFYTSVNVDDYEVSPSEASPDSEIDSDLSIINGVAQSKPILLYDGVILNSIDYGLYKEDNGGGSGSDENVVAGIIYEDINGNGVYDGGEPRRNGVNVSLVLANGTVLDNTESSMTTLGDGYYEFTGFPNGDYTLQFELESTSVATDIYQGGNTGLDSDIILQDDIFQTELLSFMDGTEILGVNAGFYYPVSIGDFIWFDFNADGLQDDNEPGANDYIIRLYDADGQQLLMTTSKVNPLTNENGFYLFNNLKPGEYYVGLNLGFGTSVTLENAGDENLDSDVDNSNGAGTTATITLSSGEQRGNVDIGLQSTPGSIGNLLWIDSNGNGIQDGNEEGLNDIEVRLYDEFDNFIESTITSNDTEGEAGFYMFENVVVGNYYIVFDLPQPYLATAAFRGGNTSKDSDITNLIEPGSSNIFSIGSGVFSDDIDCGIYRPATIGNYIWDDKDKDGTQEFGEFGISDIEVSIFRMDEGEVAKVTTNNDGMYFFEELRPGDHFIVIDLPADYQFTTPFAGTDDEIDSDFDMTGTTGVFYVDQDDINLNYDAGLVPSRATIGGRTWIDDGNGLQDFIEESITDVKINLLDESMNVIESTSTNVQGRYAFTNLATADHFVQFEAPTGYIFTLKDQSFNDNEDSDAGDNGVTDAIAVISTTNLLTVDAGLVFVGFAPEENEEIQLTGYHQNGTSHLSWVDENFQIGNQYSLLRSSDGINFEMISTGNYMNAYDLRFQENTSLLMETNYTYKVEKYLGQNIIAVSNIWMDERKEMFKVDTYPNPASEFVMVNFNHQQEGDIAIKILDIYGNQVSTKYFNQMKAGNIDLEISLENIPNGNYILMIDMGMKQQSQFISVLK